MKSTDLLQRKLDEYIEPERTNIGPVGIKRRTERLNRARLEYQTALGVIIIGNTNIIESGNNITNSDIYKKK